MTENKRKGTSRGMIVAFAIAMSMVGQAWADSTRYIVTFKSSDRYRAASVNWNKSAKLAELGLSSAQNQSGMRLLNTDAKIVRALDKVEMMIVEADSTSVAEQLKKHPAVADVEAEIFLAAPRPVNGTFGADVASRTAGDCMMETPWGIHAVKADAAWAVTKGQGSRVMILDTGIDKDHPDLVSRFEKGRNFTSANVMGPSSIISSDVTDTIGHGTHVAGTIAADGSCLVGVAPEAKVLAGKVCEDRGCSTAAIIAGIDWGVAEKVDVISMSLGGPLATPSQQRAIERAEQANVVVVAASGNDGTRRLSYPAAYPTVFAVGAVGQVNGGLKRADFSQYGPGLNITAPGVDVVSSVPQGSGRVSSVLIDMGEGKATRVKSASFAGAPQNENPISGQLVFAGLGKPEDIQKVSVRGKFALIQRGEIAFKDKVVNAMNAGATGVVIYNNADGLARGSVGEPGSIRIPVAMIEKAVGENLKQIIAQGTATTASISTDASDYDSYDGTSMATPHVSGVVALVRAANRSLTPAQVRQVLEQTAVSMNNRDEYGAGVVDAEAAVAKAKGASLTNLAVGL